MKKTAQLEEAHVVELSSSELKQFNGGIVWPAIGVAVAIFLGIANSFGDVRQGLVDGFNGTPRY